MGKILISGVGRSGTTFLTRLFTLLDLDTGFEKKTMENQVFAHCNAGLELGIESKHRILKNPCFCTEIEKIVTKGVSIDYIIVPVRNLRDSAKSRLKHGKTPGGLWHAKNLEEQLKYYYKCLAILVQDATKNEIPLIFIDFSRMVNNPDYLFDKLSVILQSYNISKPQFTKKYVAATKLSAPKN